MTTNLADPFVDSLVKRRDGLFGQVEAIKQLALDNERELSETELEGIAKYRDQIEALDKQIETVGHDLSMNDEVRDRLAGIAPSVTPAPRYRDMGQLLHDVLHQGDGDARNRYKVALKRAAEHMGTLATADPTSGHPGTATGDGSDAGDLDALYINPIVGPVIRPNKAQMPFTTAIGLRSMPSGSAFERPYIDDPDFATGVGAQGPEKTELASKKFEGKTDLIARTTIGGYLNVSAQMLQWQQGSLAQVVQQLRDRLSAAIEVFNVAELAQSTGSVDLPAGSDGPTTIGAFYDASAKVFDVTNQLATWALMGPLGWARLGKLVDLGGRPLLPTLAPSNAAGQARADTFSTNGVAGLTTVVTPAITDDTYWIGNGACIEAYGHFYPLFEAIEPSLVGRQVAVAGDFVAHRPTPFANAAVHIHDATP